VHLNATNAIFGFLALLSAGLTFWQWAVARRFPLHRRFTSATSPSPSVTLLKPLKGCDEFTERCLRSWFTQDYAGPVQLLFGVASADDPVCEIVRRLLREFPQRDAQLVVCGPLRGANFKISKLAEMETLVKHELLVVSDADVWVPSVLLANVVAPLQDSAIGLVNCFYRLAGPSTAAMQWEAVAINADFWSQVLQSQSLKPIDFALGAVMVTRRAQLREIGGFAALADCLADDYQLGNRIARHGHRIVLSPLVVECWSAPMGWSGVWMHQLRWARTIRVCQPVAYFFSILSNATLWPLIWVFFSAGSPVWEIALGCWLVRIAAAFDLQKRLMLDPARSLFVLPKVKEKNQDCGLTFWSAAWLVPLKDLLQAAIWLLAFLGNQIEWRGEKMQLRKDGTLVRL
jgi:ceramide glucosyltransferase